MFRLIPQGSWVITNAENKVKAYRRLKMSSPGQGKGNKRKSKGRGGTGRGRGRQQLPSTTPGRSQDAAKLPDEKSADEGQLAGASCISSNSATPTSFSDSKAQSEDKSGRESRSKTDSSFKASSTPTAPVKTKETTSPVEHRETLQKSSRPSPKTNEPGKSMQQPCSVKAIKAGKSPSSSPSSSSSASRGKLILIDLVTVFDAILTSRQNGEKLQCLYENLMSNNFHKTAVLKKISIVN